MRNTTAGMCAALGLALASGFGAALEGPQAPATRQSAAPSSGIQDPDGPGEDLPDAVQKGLVWLTSAQGADGGYGQDGSDPRAQVPLESEGHDVANTAMVALALLRAGTTPTDGPYREQLLAAVDFVLAHVAAAPAEGLAITERTGTQIQRKLGPNVDTFLAAMLLGELKGQMPDAQSESSVFAALDKVVDKIEKNQQADGSWNSGGGWAPVISTSLASRGLGLAAAKGREVSAAVQRKVEEYSERQFDRDAGVFAVGGDDAGVRLYKVAQVMEQASRAPAAADNKQVLDAAGEMLESDSFTAGFGSMGGEEFISYMNISDSLLRADGGEKWQKWNTDILERLTVLQNQDGSWAGHHCITGRVACTAAAILTMTTERTAARPL